jgi:SAM-dependent methyltransferase
MSKPSEGSNLSYRASHTRAGYGEAYDRTLEKGYYGIQWRLVEEPLVRELLQALCAGDRQASVLDFACGTGRITALLAHHYDRVDAVDVSNAMLEVARRSVPGSVSIHLGDVTEERDLCKGPYDLVTAFRFFMNAEDSLRKAVLAGLALRQRSGGLLLASVQCNGTSPLGIFQRIKALFGRAKQRTLTVKQLRKLFDESDYSIVAVHRYGLLPRFGGRNWLGQAGLMRFLEGVLRLAPFLGVFAQCFLVLAVKRSGT